jgi:hypothetical protein
MKIIYIVFILLFVPGLNIALAQEQIGEEKALLKKRKKHQNIKYLRVGSALYRQLIRK